MKKMNLKSKVMIICFSFIAFVLLLVSGISTAKYYNEKYYPSVVASENFYFTIDLLGNTNTDDSLVKTYHLYGGDSKSIDFNIQNYFDELRITSNDVLFNISIEGSEASRATLTCSKNTLSKNTLDKAQCHLEISEGYANLGEVHVVIKSTSPYVKTMKLIFVLHSYAEVVECTINDSDSSLYAEVVISSNIYIDDKHLSIDYSSINATENILRVDMTNPYVKDDANTNNPGDSFLKKIVITSEINPGQSVSINFYKKDISVDYSSLHIELTSTIVDGNIYYVVTLTESGGE